MSSVLPPHIVLYTTHFCPWAHRVHIVLKELGLPYEEVIIDLDRPRDDWYLKINPRGLVPSLSFSDSVIQSHSFTESAIIVQFLVDTYPSHLIPQPGSAPDAALFRARVSFFVDTWISKVVPLILGGAKASDESAREEKGSEIVQVVNMEIEPQLQDAAPFFGGKSKITLAEVLTAPFLLRVRAYSNAGLLPKSLASDLKPYTHFYNWSHVAMAQDSVLSIWDEDAVVEKSRSRMSPRK